MDARLNIDLPIIKAVEMRPVLYDYTREYPRSRILMREEAWAQVALEILGRNDTDAAITIKNYWKRIRDCYVRWVKRKREATRPMAPYQYEADMAFLNPHLNKNSGVLYSKLVERRNLMMPDFSTDTNYSIYLSDDEPDRPNLQPLANSTLREVPPALENFSNSFNQATFDFYNSNAQFNSIGGHDDTMNVQIGNQTRDINNSNQDKVMPQQNSNMVVEAIYSDSENCEVIVDDDDRPRTTTDKSSNGTKDSTVEIETVVIPDEDDNPNIDSNIIQNAPSNEDIRKNTRISSPRNYRRAEKTNGIALECHCDRIRNYENEIDEFFLCLSRSVIRLSPLVAAKIKRQISNLVMDAEIEELQKW